MLSLRGLAALLGCSSLAIAAAVGCSAPAGDEAAVDEGQLVSAPKKGAEFVRCWTVSDGSADEFFRRYTLTCRVSSAGLPGLSGSSVFVDARTTGGNVRSGRPGDAPDTDVVIGTVSKSDFPLAITVYGTWGKAQFDSISSYRVVVPATEANGAAAPAIVKLPFDIWPITILNRLQTGVVSSQQYTLDVAPFITEQDSRSTKTTFSTSWSSGFIRERRVDLEVIAPKSGGIRVSVQGPNPSVPADIAAPGTYVLDNAGLHLATAAEEAEAAGLPAADGGAANPDASPAPAPDASAPTPPPSTCGGDQQAPCVNAGARSCNDGARYNSNLSKCVACGAPGQTYCFTDANNMSGSRQCNDGARYNLNTDQCIACGAAGQTYCFNDPNNATGARKCNAGTRYNLNTDQCIACGAAGQTYCFTDPANATGSRKCNAGTRYNLNTDQCISCGASGQTYCFNDPNNATGSPVCNAGLHYNSSTGTCIP